MTQEQIIAYVDGELGPIELLRFERAMAADPAVAAEVERHRNLREAVAGHYALVAGETPPARLVRLIDRGDNVIAFPGRRRPMPRWFGQGGRAAALAATLVAGLMIGQALPRVATGPIGARDGAVVAEGELDRALDTRLASAPQAAGTSIGVSFRTADNRYCRTFSGGAGAGIGCHGAGGWTIERFVARPPVGGRGAYAQAASPSAEIMAAAQDMMAGAPLDAAQERAARDRHWAAK